MINERIIFFGTPGFAAYQLQYLLDHKVPVVAVVTTPDRPKGRGRKLQACEVKEVALKHQLPILEPNNLKNPQFQEELRSYNATLQIVVAFRMLPEAVWNMPPKGTVNLHASLLPQYRGAAPINHAIINGEAESSVSTFLLQHKIDTGNILLSKRVDINEHDNAGVLHDKLMHAGAPLLLETVKGLAAETLEGTPQEELIKEDLKEAPKIFKEDCLLNLQDEVIKIWQKIKGLSPYPGAFINVQYRNQDLILKIYDAKPASQAVNKGEIRLFKEGNELYLGCKTGALKLLEVQISGKQKMNYKDFCNGFEVENIKISL